MIVGIGIDIVNISRIERVLARHGERFLTRIFTPNERRLAQRLPNQSGILAKRWAAKEACSKALGTGMREGIRWQDLEVQNLRTGFPVMSLKGQANHKLESMIPHGCQPEIFLTMSDDYPWAIAKVIIQATPPNEPYSGNVYLQRNRGNRQ